MLSLLLHCISGGSPRQTGELNDVVSGFIKSSRGLQRCVAQLCVARYTATFGTSVTSGGLHISSVVNYGRYNNVCTVSVVEVLETLKLKRSVCVHNIIQWCIKSCCTVLCIHTPQFFVLTAMSDPARLSGRSFRQEVGSSVMSEESQC